MEKLSTAVETPAPATTTYRLYHSRQPSQNIFWITHECSYLHSKMTCVTHPTKTHAQVKRDAYYIIYEGKDNYEINDVEPLPETVCHLLVKYYGYEICEYDEAAVEIDLLYIWQGPRDPDLRTTDKSWLKWLELSRFRFWFHSELLSIMDGSLDFNSLSQYPWSQQYESITGWCCGAEYVIEVPFGSFNSLEEAKEFGRSCYGIEPYEEYENLIKLLLVGPDGDKTHTPIHKNDIKASNLYSIVNAEGKFYDRRLWKPVPRQQWETCLNKMSKSNIHSPFYAHGLEVKANE